MWVAKLTILIMKKHLKIGAIVAGAIVILFLSWSLVWGVLIDKPIAQGCDNIKSKSGQGIVDVEYSSILGITSRCDFNIQTSDAKFECSITAPVELALPLSWICKQVATSTQQ